MSEKRGGGRPSPYDKGYSADFPDVVRKIALLGATDAEIAAFLEIAESTLYLWKEKHPEFSEALRAGKLIADGEVANRLYQRAMGYEHDEVDIRAINGVIVQTPIRKVYPPDTTACIFWLKNRQRDKWRDKIETGVTDKAGNDIAMEPLEVARRIAYLLAKGDAAADNQSVH